MIEVRKANFEDHAMIYRLGQAELGYDLDETFSQKRLRAVLSKSANHIFVAFVDGEPAGYIHIQDYDVTYAPPYKNILGLAVFKAFQRQGVGKALMQAAEAFARADGAAAIRLNSGENRQGAHLFYERMGYDRVKSQANFRKAF
ncbi:N-acetyltransferase [Bacilli bacterium]|nr:N-acetyltransferase [Bacilli bacterium]GHU42120.1 N-acetyltransferase [Bacilli bacterium]